MSVKRTLIVVLAGLNVFFLALLLAGQYSLPAAYGQAGGRAGDFVCVTAKAAGRSYDVVYVLDRPEKKLHAFYPADVQSRKHVYAGFRELEKDFGKP